MIGDNEHPTEDTVETLPPLDAMLRFNPPVQDPPTPPAWVERRGSMVVIRHTWPDGSEATTERTYASDGKALIGFACQVAALRKRGYADADPSW